MSYDNSNKGTLGKNKRKEKETHPDYSGKCEIDGKGYYISAWLKTAGPSSQNPGEKFFSLAFKPKQADPGAYTPPQTAPAAEPKADTPSDDTDVPF